MGAIFIAIRFPFLSHRRTTKFCFFHQLCRVRGELSFEADKQQRQNTFQRKINIPNVRSSSLPSHQASDLRLIFERE